MILQISINIYSLVHIANVLIRGMIMDCKILIQVKVQLQVIIVYSSKCPKHELLQSVIFWCSDAKDTGRILFCFVFSGHDC